MNSEFSIDNPVEAACLKLLAYCRSNEWAGYEPYDVLNSKILAGLPFFDSRIPRLGLTQALKRSPINIRRLLLVPKTQNPKALGLFLSALATLSRVDINNDDDIDYILERLIALRSQNVSYWCWGYNFPWQTRTVLVPRWAPNLVCTTFAAIGLLDLYQLRRDDRCLNMAVSAAQYMLNELYWMSGKSTFGFAYPLPGSRGQVHNANLLAADLFCRIYNHTGDSSFLEPAVNVTRYSCTKQNEDGGWYYSESPSQEWIDNFHTGFNLCALRSIMRSLGTAEFEANLRRGFDFYRSHFFRQDGAVRYFHDRTYPIDTHCVAQSIITLLDLRDLGADNMLLARRVFQWAMDRMWDKRGFFYYRILRLCTIRTSYMRWTQAWMLLALSMLLAETAKSEEAESNSATVAAEV